MAGMNKVMLIGNLGRDPDVRETSGGGPVVNLSVATSESWNDRATGERKTETEWHRVTVFGAVANTAAKYLRKGSKVYIEGRLKTRKWEDKQGHERESKQIVLSGFNSTLLMLDSRGEPTREEKLTESELDDAIPF